jgi:hypothetical protein
MLILPTPSIPKSHLLYYPILPTSTPQRIALTFLKNYSTGVTPFNAHPMIYIESTSKTLMVYEMIMKKLIYMSSRCYIIKWELSVGPTLVLTSYNLLQNQKFTLIPGLTLKQLAPLFRQVQSRTKETHFINQGAPSPLRQVNGRHAV